MKDSDQSSLYCNDLARPGWVVQIQAGKKIEGSHIQHGQECVRNRDLHHARESISVGKSQGGILAESLRQSLSYYWKRKCLTPATPRRRGLFWLSILVGSIHCQLASRQKGMTEGIAKERCSSHGSQRAERERGSLGQVRLSGSHFQLPAFSQVPPANNMFSH